MTDAVTASAPWAQLDALQDRAFISDWLSIGPELVEHFERGTLVEENANAMSPTEYPDGLIEGFHLLAMLDHLVNTVSFIEDPTWFGWNYGLDHVRFVSPVTTADRIRVRGAIADIQRRASGALVLYDCTIEVEGREKPAMVAKWRVLWNVADGAHAASVSPM